MKISLLRMRLVSTASAFSIKRTLLIGASIFAFAGTTSAQISNNEQFEKFQDNWKQSHNIQKLSPAQYEEMKTDFVQSQSQVTTAPKAESEPVDAAREKQKEDYFKLLKEGKPTTVVQQKTQPTVAEPVDPVREQQKAEYDAGKRTQTQNDLPEALPEWKDTGNHEADEAVYREAVNGWIKRNGHLYESEEIEFLLKPILKLEEREQTLKNH